MLLGRECCVKGWKQACGQGSVVIWRQTYLLIEEWVPGMTFERTRPTRAAMRNADIIVTVDVMG